MNAAVVCADTPSPSPSHPAPSSTTAPVQSIGSQRKLKLAISVDIPPHRFVHLPVHILWQKLTACEPLPPRSFRALQSSERLSGPDASAVSALLREVIPPHLARKLLVVDVRTSDCVGGHVPSAINLPYDCFDAGVTALVGVYAALSADKANERSTSSGSGAASIRTPSCGELEASGHASAPVPAIPATSSLSSAPVADAQQQLVFYDLYGKEQGPAAAQTFLAKFAQEFPALTPPDVFVLTGLLNVCETHF